MVNGGVIGRDSQWAHGDTVHDSIDAGGAGDVCPPLLTDPLWAVNNPETVSLGVAPRLLHSPFTPASTRGRRPSVDELHRTMHSKEACLAVTTT